MAKKQMVLKGVGPIDGKLVKMREIVVMLPVVIKGIEERELDDKKVRLKKNEILYTATRIEDAIKGWKRVYKQSLESKDKKKKKSKAADKVEAEQKAEKAEEKK